MGFPHPSTKKEASGSWQKVLIASRRDLRISTISSVAQLPRRIHTTRGGGPYTKLR